MTLKETLIEARKVIENPKDWGQGSIRERPNNTYCVMAAVEAVDSTKFNDASDLFSKLTGRRNITQWNDLKTRTHPEVLALFDKAIDSLKE